MGQTAEAIAACQQALTVNPRTKWADKHLGTIYAMAGKLEEAIAAFHQDITIDPRFAVAHDQLATLYVWQGRLEEAKAHARVLEELRQR